MSALGHKRTQTMARAMSAFGLKVDMPAAAHSIDP